MAIKHDTVTGYDFRVDPPLGRAKSIRKKCLECSTTSNEVRQCTISDCPLWPYRFGRGVWDHSAGVVRSIRTGRPTQAIGEASKARNRDTVTEGWIIGLQGPGQEEE